MWSKDEREESRSFLFIGGITQCCITPDKIGAEEAEQV